MPGQLVPVAVGEIKERFFVRSYQRGYRWGEHEVDALLEDILSIKDNDYYLQPIVVKRLDDGRFELVDGQQRLTTLHLLYRAMQKEGLKKPGSPFTIEYETRPASAAFLADPKPEAAEENIDFWHMSAAFERIRGRLTKDGDHKAQEYADEIFGHLAKRVKVIWYEAPDGDSTALFTRLNVGRIPLTNAELVKASLLLKAREAGTESRRQIEIGTQWDLIERDLHGPELWAFLTNRPSITQPTRIELLFELMVDKPKYVDRLHTFLEMKRRLDASTNPLDVWNDVLARYELVKEWFDDRDLFHDIGFLVATGTDDELRNLIRASHDMTKSAFRDSLHAKIVARLGLTRDAIYDLDYEQPQDRAKCTRVLRLFNVLSTRMLKHSAERYPFHSDKDEDWSLEHIHAQNAEELKTVAQWTDWLREHAKALRALRVDASERQALDALAAEVDGAIPTVTKESFAALSARVLDVFREQDADDDPHGIENLALLSREANSGLNNGVFEVKRRRILEMDRRGDYIPICTKRVFLKYYTGTDDQQLQLWSKQDREAYRDAMFGEAAGVLTPYLRKAP